jgi:hypothetical protein
LEGALTHQEDIPPLQTEESTEEDEDSSSRNGIGTEEK